MFPVLKKCCCGCSLETGTTIIGWTQIVFTMLFMFLEICTLTQKSFYPGLYEDLLLKVVVGSLSCMFPIILVIGVRKRREGYLLCWIIVNCIGLSLAIISTIVNAGVLFKIDAIIAVTVITTILIIIAICAYEIIVVYSFRAELIFEKENARNLHFDNPLHRNI